MNTPSDFNAEAQRRRGRAAARVMAALLVVVGCSGCAAIGRGAGKFFGAGYRACFGYGGATVCIDKPNGGTNGMMNLPTNNETSKTTKGK